MQSYENMLPANYPGANTGNGPHAAIFTPGSNAHYGHVPGGHLPFNLPHTPHMQHAAMNPMAALAHSFNAMGFADAPRPGALAMSPALTVASPSLSMVPGPAGLEQPYLFWFRDGMLYTRPDLAPYTFMHPPMHPPMHGPPAPGRPYARYGPLPNQVGFVGNGAYVPVTPQQRVYATHRAEAPVNPPEFGERQVSIGSSDEQTGSPETPEMGAAHHIGPMVNIARTDMSPVLQYGHGSPSPRHYLQAFEPGKIVKSIGLHKATAELLGVTGTMPPIPQAVPAVLASRKTLFECFDNPTGTTNVYIRGLHPDTTDEMLFLYAFRFGQVANSKAMIDNQTGLCKGYGFACFQSIEEAQHCIRGFYGLGYEVSFARESFNARLKNFADPRSTNLYVSNLPRSMTESELEAIFADHMVHSKRIIKDEKGRSKGVGFARFASRDECEEIISKFHGHPIGQEQLPLQVRYADTPEQKRLKQETQRRREFRANEYNAMAYGHGNAALFPFQAMRAAQFAAATAAANAAPRFHHVEPTWAGHMIHNLKGDAVVTEQAVVAPAPSVVEIEPPTKTELDSTDSVSEVNETASPGRGPPAIAYGDTYSGTKKTAVPATA
ncbi:MAG: hypothetical protein M1826_007019 [Phylliscum demangeonii]|nr:MAG: hypothetical protein M1826_007019 [Phylliscum demangeonii]